MLNISSKRRLVIMLKSKFEMAKEVFSFLHFSVSMRSSTLLLKVL